MKDFIQLAKDAQIDDRINSLKNTIHDLPLRFSEKIRWKEITIVDEKDIYSLLVMSAKLKKLNDLSPNFIGIDLDMEIIFGFWIFIENQLIMDFSTYIANSYLSRKEVNQKGAAFDLDKTLNQWFRECRKKAETQVLSEQITARLTSFFEPELESNFTKAFNNFRKKDFLDKINKLDLHHDRMHQKAFQDFIDIFDKRVRKVLILRLIKKFAESIPGMVADDCAVITDFAVSVIEAEKRTVTLEQKTGELEGRTGNLEKTTANLKTRTTELERKTRGLKAKTGKLKEETRIKLKLGRHEFFIRTKSTLIAFSALLIILALLFKLFPPAAPTVTPAPDLSEINKKLEKLGDLEKKFEALEKKFDQIRDNQKIIKVINNIVYESFRGTKRAEDGETIVSVDIDILSEIYRWECGNYEKIVRGDKEYEPADIISDYIKNENLKDSKGLICVGLASQEGIKGDEEKRAGDRMETLINAARNAFAKANIDSPIYGLNLGQFVGEGKRAPCDESTLWQRRVILLKIIKQKKNIEPEELKNGIIDILEEKAKNKHIVFPIDIREYSKYNKLVLTEGSEGKTDDKPVPQNEQDVNE